MSHDPAIEVPPSTDELVVPVRRFRLVSWGLLAAAQVAVWATYLVFRNQPGRVGSGLRALQPVALSMVAAFTVVLVAIVATFRATVTVGERGVTRRGVPTESWLWEEFTRAEMRRGVGVVLYRPVNKRRRAKTVVVGNFAGAGGIERLAVAIGAYLPVERRKSRRWVRWVLEAATVAAMLAVLGAGLYDAPMGTRLALKPGTALQIEDRVSLRPALFATRQRSGTILSLSVGVGPATAWSWFMSLRDPSVQLVPRKAVYGHETAQQSDADDIKDNSLAKAAATYLVLGRLGHPVAIAGGEPVVVYSPPGSPLHDGDRVLDVNGEPTPYIEDLYARLESIDADLQGHPVGHQVDVVASDPAGHTIHARVTLGPPGEIATLPSLDHIQFTSVPLSLGPAPFTVSIDTAGETGPSAGLALTLGLLDAVGPAPILGAGRVAVTGTIAPDGTVGPIGGLRQKVTLAEQQGARMLIVPCDQAKAARVMALPGLPVVGVRTFDEALGVLAGARPSCPSS